MASAVVFFNWIKKNSTRHCKIIIGQFLFRLDVNIIHALMTLQFKGVLSALILDLGFCL